MKFKLINSLEKTFENKMPKTSELKSARLLKGERFCFQLAAETDFTLWYTVKINSPLKDYIKIYRIENAVMDLAAYPYIKDKNYLTKSGGVMPDILIPAKEDELFTSYYGASCVWFELNVPEDFKSGEYEIKLEIQTHDGTSIGMKNEKFKPKTYRKKLTVKILDLKLIKNEIRFTQWMYLDCISAVHDVPVFSEKHWELIEKYIQTAVYIGMNMMLTPVHTPPLDTSRGIYRDYVGLIDISYDKNTNKYSFDCKKLERFIEICLKCGIEYFEIAHLFSQWGSEFAAPVKVDGEYKFGWHVKADSQEYTEFLKQYIPAITKTFDKYNLRDKIYFHISDEPYMDNIESYKKTYNILKPLVKGIKTMDALSSYEFYKQGLIDCPVTATNHIDEFLKHDVENQWAYYCCSQGEKVGNRFLAMPSYRNRILGIQMFKYNIKGFLHWGYNFYNSQYSLEKINPYVTTSANGAFPSGDTFSVYPAKDGVYLSMRSLVFYDALQDIRILNMVSEKIGHKKTVEMIENIAKSEITFLKYPHRASFILNVIDKAKQILEMSFLEM